MQLDGVDLQIEVTSSGTTFNLDTLVKSVDVELRRNEPERAVVRLARTTGVSGTTNFDPMDVIEIDTKLSSETTFMPRFYGFVEEVGQASSDDVVELVCSGESKKLALSYIPYKEYGQNYVDGQRFNLSETTGSAIYAQLDTGVNQDPIVPLQSVRMAFPIWDTTTFTNMPLGDMTQVPIFNKATYRAVAQRLQIPRAVAGGEIEVWLQMRKVAEPLTGPTEYPTSTLSIEIYTSLSGDGYPENVLTFSGSVVASALYDVANISTVLDFHAVTLTVLEQGLDIISANNMLQDINRAMYIVLKLNTAHNSGQVNVAMYDITANKLAAVENTTSTLSQTEWTVPVNGQSFTVLGCLYLDDAQFVQLDSDIDYITDVSTQRIYFWQRVGSVGAGLGGASGTVFEFRSASISNFKGTWNAVSLNNLGPIKCSFWKGAPDYSSTIENFANDWILPWVDSIDISISDPPDLTFAAFVFQNITVMDALNDMMKWSNTVWRIYRNQSGSKVFEVRSSTVPGDFTGLPAAEQDDRSFYRGDDVTTGTTGDPSYVRLVECSKRRILGNRFGRTLARNAHRAAMSSNSLADSGFTSVVQLVTSDGLETPGAADAANTRATEYVERVHATVVGVAMDSNKSLFDSTNQLIYLKDTQIGVDAAYIVKEIRMRISTTDGIAFSIVCEDVVSTRYPDESKLRGDKFNDMIRGGLSGMSRAGTGLSSSKMGGVSTNSDGSEHPTDLPMPGGGKEEFVYAEDLTVTFDATNAAYLIGLGIGGVSSADLATTAAVCQAVVQSVDSGANYLLTAEFRAIDFAKKASSGFGVFGNDTQIGAIAIYFRATSVDGDTLLKAVTLGPSGTIVSPQPRIQRKGKTVVCYKISA